MVSLLFVLLCSASAFQSSSAYECPVDSVPQDQLCPGICCLRFYAEPGLITGPTCQIQAAWFTLSNGTWVWPFPTFCFTYYYFVEDIMGSGASVPAAVPVKDTEVLTVHPHIELHGIKETTSGFIFPLINIYINCALGTLLATFCFLVCVLLCYLGYQQFCHPGKKHKGTAPPPTCVTCSTCPSLTSLRPAWDKEAMEDRYYASMQRHQHMRYKDDNFGFAPPPHG
jgi:hypothetical protein